MPIRRRCASRLLELAAQRSSGDAQAWATAMRAELDAIDGEWAALWWAVGGATSLVRHFGPPSLLARPRRPAPRRRGVGAVAAEVLSGVVVGGAIVATIVFADLALLGISLHQFALTSLPARLLLVAAIDASFLAATIALPRRRRPLAAGMVLCGMLVFIHVAAHG